MFMSQALPPKGNLVIKKWRMGCLENAREDRLLHPAPMVWHFVPPSLPKRYNSRRFWSQPKLLFFLSCVSTQALELAVKSSTWILECKNLWLFGYLSWGRKSKMHLLPLTLHTVRARQLWMLLWGLQFASETQLFSNAVWKLKHIVKRRQMNCRIAKQFPFKDTLGPFAYLSSSLPQPKVKWNECLPSWGLKQTCACTDTQVEWKVARKAAHARGRRATEPATRDACLGLRTTCLHRILHFLHLIAKLGPALLPFSFSLVTL